MYELEDVNGNILALNTDTFINGIGGLGNPQITYQETKGFLGNQVIVERFNLEPRQLTFELHNMTPFSDDEFTDYWDKRTELLKFFNPYLAPYKLRITLSNGTQYELRNIYPTNGLSFTNTESFNNYIISEPVTVTAKNPVIYNTQLNTATLTSGTTGAETGFNFPLVFADEGNSYIHTIDYNGSWVTYPIITINNQYDTALITYNGATITLINGITDSESRIIDLTENNLSVVDHNGTNRWDELQVSDNLLDFIILPYSSKTLSVVITNPSINTSVSLSYETTYIGI